MSIRLILTRHAKSSWSDPTVEDHDRVLNRRGRDSADAIGIWLNGKGFVPGTVLCSSAARCVETVDRIVPAFGAAPEITHKDGMYNASSMALLSHLQAASGDVVMMAAHNPGIGEFAEELVKMSPARPRFSIYPSGATTVIDFDVDSWADVRAGQGDLVDFIIPRDLIS